jgi:hypothetical protein
MFNETFTALEKEAQFTKDMLGSGATQIRKANYAEKGIYFQAFTSLSTGLERIGKLCLMLDYYINNNGKFPDYNYLKKEIGHKIDLLYKKSLEVKASRELEFEFLQDLDGEIHQNILNLLSSFAVGDRYSNINLLTSSRQQSDPISEWFNKVDVLIFDQRVTEKKKQKIAHNAHMVSEMSQRFTMVQHSSESGDEINTVLDASFRTEMQQAVAPYRQLYVIQIIRFWFELLRTLQYKAMELGKQDIPFFGEILGGFYNPDSYIRTRKTWDTI